ncbi:hypothetical protein ACJ5NV_15940 [Loktanella agnita]
MALAAKRAGFLTGGLLLCGVGLAFLTVSAWFALAPTIGITGTAAIIAGFYFGLGLILIGMGSRARMVAPVAAAPAAAAAPFAGPPMMQAFLYGLQAGAASHLAKR